MSLFLTDLVGVGPQPAAYWVLWQLAVFCAEEPCCSWRLAPVWHWTFLQPSDWTAWPCSPTPSASLWAPAKTHKNKWSNQIPTKSWSISIKIRQYRHLTNHIQAEETKGWNIWRYKWSKPLLYAGLHVFPSDVSVHYHLDLLARLGHIFQHA